MSLQAKITKLENSIQTRQSAYMQKTDRAVVLWAQMHLHEVKTGKPMDLIPDNMKVTHADWDLLYAETLSRKNEFSSEKSFQKHLKWCYEIKTAIDKAHGWKD